MIEETEGSECTRIDLDYGYLTKDPETGQWTAHQTEVPPPIMKLIKSLAEGAAQSFIAEFPDGIEIKKETRRRKKEPKPDQVLYSYPVELGPDGEIFIKVKLK